MNPFTSASVCRTPTRQAGWLGWLAMCLVLVSGCATLRTIPGTKVADTPQHRELLQRVEEYRIAMEQREAGKLLTLAHPNYYEDSGTPSAQDDYAYARLKRDRRHSLRHQLSVDDRDRRKVGTASERQAARADPRRRALAVHFRILAALAAVRSCSSSALSC